MNIQEMTRIVQDELATMDYDRTRFAARAVEHPEGDTVQLFVDTLIPDEHGKRLTDLHVLKQDDVESVDELRSCTRALVYSMTAMLAHTNSSEVEPDGRED